MKNFCITFFVLFILILTVVFGVNLQLDREYGATNDYLRIHVRANSNSEADQSIKYIVKDEVVKFITPYAAKCVDKATAMQVIGSILEQIEDACDNVLQRHGFFYKTRAKLCQEKFPTRVYGDLTLAEGVYDALILELGEGVGDNWWCVIYPPLCFTYADSSVEYQSLIYEIIQNFYK
ncbi:MAG: hypothetical protein E7370_03950 [Clostridiales bacterium]|nr:hypothetical protein [Clostridiales bacterium]